MAAGTIKFTVDHTKIDADQTNIPIAFNLTTACGTGSYDATAFFTELSDANRKKVKIYKSDYLTQCYAEIESGYDFNNKEVVYHVKAPSVSSTVDEVFYLDYDSTFSDNTTYIGDTGDLPAQTVWDNNFIAVWHMATTGTLYDSTSNGLNGTVSGLSLVAGSVGNGLYNNRSLGKYVSIAHDSSLNLTGGSTVEQMINQTHYNSQQYTIAKGGDSAWKMHGYDEVDWRITTDAARTVDLGLYPQSAWTGIAGTYDGSSDQEGFVNGVSVGVTSGSGAIATNTSALLLSAKAVNSGPFYGTISETRLSNIVRSDAWIKATSYSLKDDLLALETYGIPFEFGEYNLTGTATSFKRTSAIQTDSGEYNISALQTSLIRKNIILPGWMSYKGEGVWDFVEQPNKWGYLNNSRWTESPEAPVQYDQNPLEEPQIWEGYKSSKASDANGTNHVVCGHWHKFSPDIFTSAEETIKANIYLINTFGADIYGVYFNGSNLTFIGTYESPSEKDINGLDLYEGNLITIAGAGSNAEVRLVNTVPVNNTLNLIQSYTPFNAYDIRAPEGCNLTMGRTSTEYVYTGTAGELVVLDTHIKQARESYGTVVLGTDGNHYYNKRRNWGDEPITGIWNVYWVAVGDNEGTIISTFGDGDCHNAGGDDTYHIIVGDYLYIGVWASLFHELIKINLNTLTIVAANHINIYKRLTYYNHIICAIDHEAEIYFHNSGDLSEKFSSISLAGYGGDVCVAGEYFIAVTISGGGLYKIETNTCTIVDSVTWVDIGISYFMCRSFNDQYVILGRTKGVAIFDIINMVLVDDYNSEYDVSGYDPQTAVVKIL